MSELIWGKFISGFYKKGVPMPCYFAVRGPSGGRSCASANCLLWPLRPVSYKKAICFTGRLGLSRKSEYLLCWAGNNCKDNSAVTWRPTLKAKLLYFI